MPLDSDSKRRMRILRFLRDCGGQCTREQWKQFDSGPVHLEIDMLSLLKSGYVKETSTGEYTLTEAGKHELVLLEGVND